MNKTIDTLTQKEMTRHQFLLTMGFALGSVFGLGSIIKLLTGKTPQDHIAGSSSYGNSSSFKK